MAVDAIELLEQQHRQVEEMFERFEDADPSEKQRIVREVIASLRLHTAIEEEIFYPAVRERMDADDEIDEDLEEHHVVDVLLDELEGMSPGDERYDAKVEVLAELVEHHVEEEEDDLFPEVRDELPAELLQELGERMQQRAEDLQSDEQVIDLTKEELYAKAQELDIDGRSQMSKRQLANAVRASS